MVGEHALEIREVPRPQPKSTEVLIKVRAIGMNRAELPGSYGSGHIRVTVPFQASNGRARWSNAGLT